MTSEELEQLKAYAEEIGQKKGFRIEIDSHSRWVITYARLGAYKTKGDIHEIHGGHKLSAHKRAIDKYVEDLENPDEAHRRESKYHKDSPDFPTIDIR